VRDRLVTALPRKDPARLPDSVRVSAVLSRIRNLPGGNLGRSRVSAAAR
jgi:hypothetical protein